MKNTRKIFFIHKILVKKDLEFIGCNATTAIFFAQRKSSIPTDELEEFNEKRRLDMIGWD